MYSCHSFSIITKCCCTPGELSNMNTSHYAPHTHTQILHFWQHSMNNTLMRAFRQTRRLSPSTTLHKGTMQVRVLAAICPSIRSLIVKKYCTHKWCVFAQRYWKRKLKEARTLQKFLFILSQQKWMTSPPPESMFRVQLYIRLAFKISTKTGKKSRDSGSEPKEQFASFALCDHAHSLAFTRFLLFA